MQFFGLVDWFVRMRVSVVLECVLMLNIPGAYGIIAVCLGFSSGI